MLLLDVPLGVFMRCADHLRKVDNNGLPSFFSNEDIEFVKVTVDEAGLSKSDDHIHEC